MKTFLEVNEKLRQYWPEKLSRRHVYTTETMIELVDYLGNPQDKLKIIHVAGTSGKTSTCYYSAALLKAAGKKVGLTVSPHVDEINERVQINLVPLSEEVFCREMTEFLGLVKKSGLEPSYFEVLLAFAYWAFVRQGVEYAVIEVGMGGLTDATNVVNRQDKVCVFTDIGMDHINSLGSTIGEIAENKSGIIQLHNNVFCYRQDAAAITQITKRAKQKQAELHILDVSAEESGLTSLPLFQRRNLGLARQAVNGALAQSDQPELTDKMVAEAAKTYIPARMEEVRLDGKVLVLDGAHNPQKLQALSSSMQAKYPGQPIAAIVSFLGGRSYRLEDSVEVLARLLEHVIVTDFRGSQDERHRSEDSAEIVQVFKAHGAKSVEVITDPKIAFQALLQRPEPVVMVAGSFYLLNDIRPLLKR